MSSNQQEPCSEATDSEQDTPASVVETENEKNERSESTPVSGDKSEASRIEALETEVAALREELSSVNDKYLRKLADDVNFRKRMAREKEEGQRFAVSTLLADLIPVLDDFDRAIASAETQRDYAVLHDGVAMIRRQLGSVLETKYGLVRYESLGKPFDPNRHEAVAMIQGGAEDGDETIVAEEFLPGYGLHERILRTAKVKVRMPGPKASAGEPDGSSPSKNEAN